LVEVRGASVVEHRAATEATAAEALASVLGRTGGRFADGEVTVTWTVGVEVRRLPLRQVPVAAWRAAMLEAAETELFVPDDDMAVAGQVMELANGTLEAVVAVTGASSIGATWAVAQSRNLSLTVPALCLTADGTYLSLRDASAELTVVSDGRAVASRSIPGGDLDTLLSGLHLDRAAAQARFARVATGTSHTDPEAIALVDAHVDRISREVGEQVRAWRQQSIRTGRVAYVMGAGATIPSLPSRLQSAGLGAAAAPPPNGIDVTSIPEWDRFAYFGAVAAAASVHPSGATTVLASRTVEAGRLRAAEAATTGRRRLTAVTLAASAAAALFLPLGVAGGRQSVARQQQDRALNRFSRIQDVDAALTHAEAGRTAYGRLASADIRWADLQRQVTAALPVGAAVEALRLNRVGPSLNIEVAAGFPGEPFQSVAAWAERMRRLNEPPAAPGAAPAAGNEVTVRSFAYDPDARVVHASLAVAVPVRPPFVEPRELPPPPAEPEGRA